MTLDRRQVLGGLLAAAGGVAVGWPSSRGLAAQDLPTFLIVMGCYGGASMIDLFQPVATTEAASLSGRGRVIGMDVVQPKGSVFRCPDRDLPRTFLERYASASAVVGVMASSVNHTVAQARVMNGRGVNGGRTLPEAVAALHGAGLPLPNVCLGRGGFAAHGTDPTLDASLLAEVVPTPGTLALATHGWRGVVPVAEASPEQVQAVVEAARALRDGSLEGLSPFARTFAASTRRRELVARRADAERRIEAADLVRQLLYEPDVDGVTPLTDYGLASSPWAERVAEVFPDALSQVGGVPAEPLHAQAALAWLLLASGASAAVTLTDPGTDGRLAFDQGHGDHPTSQADHWDRMLDVTMRLIPLLQEVELPSHPGSGVSLWDRTVLAFFTEFGREKWQGPGETWGTDHHQNNGVLLVSPRLRGNQALGAVDPRNGFISGFDPVTGEALPFGTLTETNDPPADDPHLPPGEDVLYGAVAELCGVRFDGQVTLPALT